MTDTENFESGFQFRAYKVEDIQFKLNTDYEKVTDLRYEASFNFEFSIAENREAKIFIRCYIFEDCVENNYPFSLFIKICGHFAIRGDIKDDKFRTFCEVNGTAALFPYLRALISNITMSAGIKPLHLPLFNICKMIEKRKATREKEVNDV